jgi:Protein of unknown function (DUF4058)
MCARHKNRSGEDHEIAVPRDGSLHRGMRAVWGDFHHDLISEIKYALAKAAPERYLVRAGERSYVVLIEEEHREAFVEIYEATPEQRLVTSIEVLSPSNKRPRTPGWHLYLRKRQSLLLGDVNLVEIDLLWGGERMPMLDPWPESPYTMLAARAKKYDVCQVWPVYFQMPSPSIPVPLAKPDPDIPLELQPMIDAIYQRSRYERSIDYDKPLTPPLDAGETAWLKQPLHAKSKH